MPGTWRWWMVCGVGRWCKKSLKKTAPEMWAEKGDGPADGRHLVSAADVHPDDNRVFIVASGAALLTSVYLDDPPRPPRTGGRRHNDAHHHHNGSPASASSSDDDGADEDSDAAALRSSGLPTSFTGGGGVPRRRPPRREKQASDPTGGDHPVLRGDADIEDNDRNAGQDNGGDAAHAPPSCPPSHSRPRALAVRKYWHHRHALWSSYSAGIVMDDVGWFSATPEALARHHASRCAPSPGLIVDAFAGCGGNAVRFAERAGVAVIAVELDGGRAGATQTNACVVASAADPAFPSSRAPTRLDCIAADFLAAAPRLSADAVFLSPPWGGPSYKAGGKTTPFVLEPDVGGCGVGLTALVAAAAAAHAPGAPLRVAAFLPRTARLDQCAAAAPPGAAVEIERAVVGGRVKGVTVYYGVGARRL